LLVDALLGADLQIAPSAAEAERAAADVADRLRGEGRRVYFLNQGRMFALGSCLGYALCAAEIVEQLASKRTKATAIYLSSSGQETPSCSSIPEGHRSSSRRRSPCCPGGEGWWRVTHQVDEAKSRQLRSLGESLDRLITIDLTGRSVIHALHRAARERQGDEPLSSRAARSLVERVGPRDVVLISTGMPVGTLPSAEQDGPVGAATLARGV